MTCSKENNSTTVLNCFLSSLMFSTLTFLRENINIWYINIAETQFLFTLINILDTESLTR